MKKSCFQGTLDLLERASCIKPIRATVPLHRSAMNLNWGIGIDTEKKAPLKMARYKLPPPNPAEAYIKETRKKQISKMIYMGLVRLVVGHGKFFKRFPSVFGFEAISNVQDIIEAIVFKNDINVMSALYSEFISGNDLN